MKGGFIFFAIGVILIVLKWKKFVVIEPIWIVGCFGLWFILLYISIHKKNKDKKTPQAVQVVNQ